MLIPFAYGVGEAEAPFGRAQTTEEYVRSYFIDIPVMADIAYCESRFRHVGSAGSRDRGKINHGVLGGIAVNDYYHLATAVNV